MSVIPFPTAPLEAPEWEHVEAEKVISGQPKSAYKLLYSDPSGRFHSGLYECTPGKWHVSYSEDEFCTLLEGHVVLTNDKGKAQEFSAPDSFLIPSGFSGTWEATTPVRKIFVVHEQTAA
ncbi:MAG: DUF861 domain-containing protein [Alphaproteobacteria bacterium]|nr:DUF861 domain-containing protein [Alphaproteobacteria bacterium]